MTGDTTLLKPVYGITGQKGRLYYYQGNFFMPLTLRGDQVGPVKRAIRQFDKANPGRIDRDRTHPDYKSLTRLFDEQLA